MGFDSLIDLGMSKEEATLLTTPARELKAEQLAGVLGLIDKRVELVKSANDSYVSKKPKGNLQIMKKDAFENFQSPCDTNVIITNERERQDDLKRNGCVDAREFIPHGKTSLLDGRI